MQLTAAQENVLSKALAEADPMGKGSIPASDLPEIIQRITGQYPLKVQMDELLKNEAGTAITQLDSELFRSKMCQYLADYRVTNWGTLTTPLAGPVGIDGVATQLQKRALKEGFQFNIMVVGASGLGKSTLCNTLFKSLVSRTPRHTSTLDIPKTVVVQSVTRVLEENGSRLKLTITDTPGFGDQLNNTGAWEPVVDYIKERYSEYLREESLAKRKRYIPDTRVHAVIYCIAPTGHSLKALDVASLKSISKIANVIPVIAKADIMTVEEQEGFKRRIMQDIEAHQIRMFPFVTEDDDEEVALAVQEWRSQMPFTVIGSDSFSDNRLVRRTNCGTLYVDDPEHCNLHLLRDLLIRTHMVDLVKTTDKVFYEEYRTEHYRVPS